MINFYSSRSIRVLKIAEMIIKQDQPISFKKIQTINQCSLRTVYSDLEYLEKEALGLIKIEYIQNTIKSESSSSAQLMNLRAKILNKELLYQLLLVIYFEEKKHDIIDLSLKLKYSETHIRKQIHRLNHYLKDFDSKIICDQSYSIQTNNPLRLATLIFVLLRQGNHENKILTNSKDEKTFQDFIDDKQIDLPLVLERELLLIQHLLIFKDQENQLLFDKILEASHFFKKEKIEKKIHKLTENYSFNLNKQLHERFVNIYKSITLKLFLNPFMIDNFMNRYESFYHSFKKENRTLSLQLEKDLHWLAQQTQLNYPIYTAELVFYLYTEMHDLRNYKEWKIGIYSDFGEKHCLSLIRSLQKHFPQHEIEPYQRTKDYNLIITTNLNKSKREEIPQVVVDDYLSYKDIKAIYRAVYLE